MLKEMIQPQSQKVKKNRYPMKILKKVMKSCQDKRKKTQVQIKNQKELENLKRRKKKTTN